MATLLWCWVYRNDANRIFPVSISGTATVAALKEAIKNEKPIDFGHIDADALALYSIPMSDDDEQLAKDIEQWRLSDMSKPLPPRRPLYELDLSGSLIVVHSPELCA